MREKTMAARLQPGYPRCQRLASIIGRTMWLLLLTGVLTHSTMQPPSDLEARVFPYVHDAEFDFTTWIGKATILKIASAALGASDYLNEAARIRLVREYFHLQAERERLESQIARHYADPAIVTPEIVTAELQQQSDSLRRQQELLQPFVETILAEQLSVVLTQLGLSWGGQPLPPVAFHFTSLPLMVVISPRTEIRQAATVGIEGNLTLENIETLEEHLARDLDVSALVVPVGGLGAYPTMIAHSSNLHWITTAIAHEWVHNYLTLKPLGRLYDASPELRTMNETTASIAGDEIGALTMQRYYPDLAAPPPAFNNYLRREPTSTTTTLPSPLPEIFDYQTEMRLTRIHVDELLAQGQVNSAEAYMEMRRRLFWDHGYQIRKLNQAYFAFYGAYASDPGEGVTGTDPVGPAVRLLRRRSPDIGYFLKTMAAFSSIAQLEQFLNITTR